MAGIIQEPIFGERPYPPARSNDDGMAREEYSPDVAPAVSVLMPVRNGARFLDESLASLSAQTFENFEIIVVENGSTDSTRDILHSWAGREPRLRFESFRGQLADSLNHAASLARAPVLARLDCDDIAHPDRLSVQMSALGSNRQLVLLGSFAELINHRGRHIGTLELPEADSDIRARERTRCSFIASSTMIRADSFWLAGGYRSGLNVSEDRDLWLRLLELGEAGNLPQSLVAYRIHSGSLTGLRPVRMAVASLCVTAAGEARRQGSPEPFIRGSPHLRMAQALLGLDRAEVRRHVRARTLANRISRGVYQLPFPLGVVLRILMRSAQLSRFYSRWLTVSLFGSALAGGSSGRKAKG